jgi:hypothetical protein
LKHHSIQQANGLRYPLVGGTRQRRFDGTSFKPRKLPENAQTPTSRVHALLGGETKRPTTPGKNISLTRQACNDGCERFNILLPK